MPGPWEAYQQPAQGQQQATGPWSAYQTPAATEEDKPPSWLPKVLHPLHSLYHTVDTALGEGSNQMYQGLQGLASPESFDAAAHNASQVLRGAGTAMSPALIPAALSAPIPTAIRVGAGLATQGVTEGAGNLFGYPGMGELAGDILGLKVAQKVPTSFSMPSASAGTREYFKGALKPTDITDILHPLRLMKNVAGRIGKNYLEANTPQTPEPPEPFKPSSITRSRMPTFVPGAEEQFRSTPGTIIPRKGFTPPPEETPAPFEPFKPSSTTAKRLRSGRPDNPYAGTPGKRIMPRGGNEFTSPEEFAAKKAEQQAIVEKVLAEKGITAPAPERPNPVTKSELKSYDPANAKEVARSAFHTAYRKFPEEIYQQEMQKIIEDEVGPGRTRAYTDDGVAKAAKLGKKPLTPDEWDRVHKRLDALPDKARKSIEPPPQ